MSVSTSETELTTDYDYYDDGLVQKELEPSGLVTERFYNTVPNGAPGRIVDRIVETPPGSGSVERETKFHYDTASNAVANIVKVGRKGEGAPSYIERDDQTASRDRGDRKSVV